MTEYWIMPEIQSVNRLPARSHLIPYETPELASAEVAAGPEGCPECRSSFYMNLDGTWDFAFFDSPLKSPEAGYAWNKIKVPLSWTMQGYSAPHYTNQIMPFDSVPPNVPEENPTGWYRKNLKLPKEWNGRRVVLHIGSAESVVILYVNEMEAGVSKDSRLPCEFELNEFLTPSQAQGLEDFKVIIKVVRWSDASYVEDQDQWWFGGIHRSVFLYSTEKVFIQDAKALARIQGDCGIIPLEASLGYSELCGGKISAMQKELDRMEFSMHWSVCPIEGRGKSSRAGKEIARGQVECSLDVRNTLAQAAAEISIPHVKKWSHEEPNLYLVTLSLFTKDGRHVESTAFTTGFKTVQVKDRQLLLNGKAVYIHGVNRHEHNDRTAKTLTTEEMVHDLMLLKNHNFNAVRTCHYPDDKRWYELCDRYGIWIMDEANIENHGFYDVMSRGELWLNAYVQRVQRMVRRDKNHPCIFCWSLGNESGNGQNHLATAAWIRGYDPTRIVHYEGFVRPMIHQGNFTLESLGYGKGLTDLISPMYPTIDLIREYAQKCQDYRPIIMCEYSHAMGNANGSLKDYWEAIESTPGLQGGFIWDWIDQGILDEEKTGADIHGRKHWKYGGDFGDTPTDWDFCLNGILFPDQTPKPVMAECRRLFSPARISLVTQTATPTLPTDFEILNKFDFLPLNTLGLKWSLLADGITVLEGSCQLDDTAPGKTMKLRLPELYSAAAQIDPGTEICLNASFTWTNDTWFAKAGDLCFTDQIILHPRDTTSTACELPLQNSVSGLIKTMEPTITHAVTENECIKNKIDEINIEPITWDFANKPTRQWYNTGLLEGKAIPSAQDPLTFILHGTKDGKEFSFGTCTIRSTMSAEDSESVTKLKATFELNDTVEEYPRAGLTFLIPKDFENIQWYGRGPHENYSDRDFAALKGLHSNPIKDMGVPYIVPQENGLRTGTTFISLTGSGKRIQLRSRNEFSFSILAYSTQQLLKGKHSWQLEPCPDGFWYLTIDAAHRGVGTGACGPDPLDKYKVRPGKYELELEIREEVM